MAEQQPVRGGRWNRFLMSIMGPAQVGPYDTTEPVADTSACDKCGTPWGEHEVVHEGTYSYPRCPERRAT